MRTLVTARFPRRSCFGKKLSKRMFAQIRRAVTRVERVRLTGETGQLDWIAARWNLAETLPCKWQLQVEFIPNFNHRSFHVSFCMGSGTKYCREYNAPKHFWLLAVWSG